MVCSDFSGDASLMMLGDDTFLNTWWCVGHCLCVEMTELSCDVEWFSFFFFSGSSRTAPMLVWMIPITLSSNC
jgi:hypothetical protein